MATIATLSNLSLGPAGGQIPAKEILMAQLLGPLMILAGLVIIGMIIAQALGGAI